MANILRYVIDDIAKDLKQIVDDKLIQKAQIAFWIKIIGDRLNSQHIAKRSSGAFLKTIPNIPVQVAGDNSTVNVVKNRPYIILPKTIYDFDQDRGINYISYYVDEDGLHLPPRFTTQAFHRTTPRASRRLYFSGYEKPSPKNPFFYRTGKIIYLLGIEKVDVKKVEVGLFTAIDPIQEIDIDEPFDFPDELMPILKRQVLDLGRFSLLFPEDTINQGKAETQAQEVPTQKITSVNDLNTEE